MKNRPSFLGQYLQRFYKEYEKALADFSVEDKIYIMDVLISTVQAYRQNPIDYSKAKALNEELLKKYGKQLRAYSNARISDYFQPQSFKHLDLQHDLKLDNAGEDENYFTPEEQQHFLERVEILLNINKQQYYLLTDPQGKAETESKEDSSLSGKEEKNKAFTARRRALAIHYLDKHFKINPTGNKQPLAEFAHFLTGNTYDKIYKILRNPLSTNSDSVKNKAEESLLEDLKYIRSYFVRLELPEVVKYIDKDISS
jgi:hypothetical protein